jgi:hypothetical protein
MCLVVLTAIPLGYLDLTFEPRGTEKCTNPHTRREWRTLTDEEKHNYIQSVRCLQNLPSELLGKGNFYDDLVYVHMSIGSQCSSGSPNVLILPKLI